MNSCSNCYCVHDKLCVCTLHVGLGSSSYSVTPSPHLPPASWQMDASRNARQEYLKERINGAMFFDIDEVSDKDSSLPHMLPSPEQFAEHVGKVQPSCKVVLPYCF